jgi:competence protein ComFC
MKSFSPIRRRATELARLVGEAAFSLLYPPHCAACEADTPSGCHLCAECARQALPIQAPRCHRCSMPFNGALSGEFVCDNCEGRQFHFTCAVSPWQARAVVRDFIHRFKYDRHLYLRHQLAEWLAAGLADDRLLAPPIDVITPVPLHPVKEREREFNQAEVLAKLLARRAAKPVVSCLQRIRHTPTQTRLDREQRMENLRGAFTLRQDHAVTGCHLLLIDDIFTTGSTVDECSRVLRAAGAASVRVLTVARA